MAENFWDRVRDRAYFKHIEKINKHIPDNPEQNWVESEVEEALNEKIKEDAYFEYERHGGNDFWNYMIAKHHIDERVKFLAFYMHESNYDRSPEENWIEAQKLYISQY